MKIYSFFALGLLFVACNDTHLPREFTVHPNLVIEELDGTVIVDASEVRNVTIARDEYLRRIYFSVKESAIVRLLDLDDGAVLNIKINAHPVSQQTYIRMVGSGQFSLWVEDEKIGDQYLSELILKEEISSQ